MNLFFVGDELVAGVGDPKALGWTGRVVARTEAGDTPIIAHTLAVPGETTSAMSARWREEIVRRMVSRTPSAVVFGIGHHDAKEGVSPTKTTLNITGAIDQVKHLGMRCVIVGPPPAAAKENERISELAATVRDAAARRDAPFVDTFGPLAEHEQWLTDMETAPYGLPAQAGYGLMAYLVLHADWPSRIGLAGE